MCKGKFSPIGKCCLKDLCSPSGQCCLEQLETVCGEGCCTHGQCTTTGTCCAEEEACGTSCCTADKPYCVDGKCTAYCDKKNPCPPPSVCAETRCCPEGSYIKLCGGKCCSEDSLCVKGKCTPCSQGEKACHCPPGKKNCTSSCIPEFETCKHGVPTCPKGNVLCGGVCMNPLDRVCKKGKITTCPEYYIVDNNNCKKCPPNNIIRDFKCQACPYGEISVGNNCHPCITHLECRYSSPWNWWMLRQNVCFSAIYATFKDGTVQNVTQGGLWTQQCCSDLAKTVQTLTNLFFCPGVPSYRWSQVPPFPPYQHNCYSGFCTPTPTAACEKKCFNACLHGQSFTQVAACFWLCLGACELTQSKGEDKSEVERKKK